MTQDEELNRFLVDATGKHTGRPCVIDRACVFAPRPTKTVYVTRFQFDEISRVTTEYAVGGLMTHEGLVRRTKEICPEIEELNKTFLRVID